MTPGRTRTPRRASRCANLAGVKRPTRVSVRWFVIALLAAGAPALAGCSGVAGRLDAFRTGQRTTHATAQLRRGMNFGDAMDAPNEGDWGWTLSASDFSTVRAAGFDHVRVPMRISSHADPRPPYQIEHKFLRRMDWVIDQALSNDLAVIVDMHHYEPMMHAPRVHADRLVGLWREIATRYKDLPPAVVYEILNEPTDKLTADVWNPILARVIAAIRAIDPTRTLIVEGAHWASATDLRDTLQIPPGDPNIVASFHMYAPMYFTHQGFSWMPSQYETRGVVFPGPPARPVAPSGAADEVADSHDFFERYNTEGADTNPGGPAAIIEQMEMAKTFADRTGLRVYLGEFGAGVNADVASRARWTRAARTEAEKRGFGWGYWDFCRNFAAYASLGFTGRWIPEIRAALVD
jgi:endoglucanase